MLADKFDRICPVCGWGEHIQPACKTPAEVYCCLLNKENGRKFKLQHKSSADDEYVAFRSVRYQGPEGKGDSSHQIEPLTRGDVRAIMKCEVA